MDRDDRPRQSTAASTFDAALNELSRRPLTEHELKQRLDRAGSSGADWTEILARLREAGYVDDAELSLQYILTRAARMRHGKARLLRELKRRGVADDVAARAWCEAETRHGLDIEAVLREALTRRLGSEQTPVPPAALRRAYGAMLRAGFEAAAIRSALDPYFERLTSATSDDRDLPGAAWSGSDLEID